LSPVGVAVNWIDGGVGRLDKEVVPLREAAGRVLAEDIRAERSIPACDSAAVDGFAVAARETLGASSYNPLSLPLIEVASGDALGGETGADAVLPREQGELNGTGRVVIVEAMAPGVNVDKQGTVVPAGALLISEGALLGPQQIGICAAARVSRLAVVHRPRVRILVTKGTQLGRVDSNGPMLSSLVERDGGTVSELAVVDRIESALVNALAVSASDIVLLIGGTGSGRDDESAPALAAAGELAVHGVAIHPGETTGLGRTAAGVPVVLLPGSPPACLWSYEFFAGRAIRRLGGRDPRLPYFSLMMATARKIISSIGRTEICPVRRLSDSTVEPLVSFSEIGLMAAVKADGFVIVPETSEGYAPGALVNVHLYKNC
jgi:molybdopterin molybdotransferase